MKRTGLGLWAAGLLVAVTAAAVAQSRTWHGIPLPPGAEAVEGATWTPPVGPAEGEWERIERQAYTVALSVEELEAFYLREMPKAEWQPEGDPQMMALGVLAWSDPRQRQAWITPVPMGALPRGESYNLVLTWAEKGG